jgi:acetyl-CoA carboxylase alpha subunit
MEEIFSLAEQLKEKNKNINEYVEYKKLEIDTWNNEISCLEEKIKCLKRKIKVNECSIDESVQSNNVIRTQLKDYANKLCNSIEYKMDLKELNK